MAEQKSDLDANEPATPFKLEKAHERGSIARSGELTFAAVLLACVACVYGLGVQMMNGMALLIHRSLPFVSHDQLSGASVLNYVDVLVTQALKFIARCKSDDSAEILPPVSAASSRPSARAPRTPSRQDAGEHSSQPNLSPMRPFAPRSPRIHLDHPILTNFFIHSTGPTPKELLTATWPNREIVQGAPETAGIVLARINQ